MPPLVSIVIPTFDRPAYLEEAVASALAQTYPQIEVLVGDNGPSDVTTSWSDEVTSDPRFIYRRNPRNLGMCGNFNALADAARGEFFVAIGDDDRLLPEFVSRTVEQMKPEVSVVFCNHYLIDESGQRLEAESRAQTRRYKRDRVKDGVIESAQIVAWQQSIAMSAALIRTKEMQRLRFREDLNTPDAEFFIRLAQEDVKFAFLSDYLVEYRTHLAATSSAGLCSERLVEYLLPIAVPPAVEPYKRQLLGPLMMNAVSRCLRRGESERARTFLRSHYYPTRAPIESESRSASQRMSGATEHAVKLGLQHLCASLPPAIGTPTYRAVWAAKDWAGL